MEEPNHPSTRATGIDLGVVRFATLSDGTVYSPLQALRKLSHRLTLIQRRLLEKRSTQRTGRSRSSSLSQLHTRIADARRDFLHKISTEISKNHAMVCMEDLKVSQMSAKGKQKSRLNTAILDQGWYEFRRQLDYKLRWRGGTFQLIDPRYTSQRCPNCGHISPENRPTQARFSCERCGHTGHADHIAAQNILAVGHTVSACGETWPDRAMAQESPCL